MIPSAPEALRRGTISRTTGSSMMVSTATPALQAQGGDGGIRKDGRRASSPSRSFRRMFIFNPTFDLGLDGPAEQQGDGFDLSDASQGSCQAERLATRRGVETRRVSTILNLLAFNELPVSVTSTMASTNSRAFALGGAPGNSTSALTPCFLSHRLVMSTTSVAMRLPSRSWTVWMGDSSGTASTQRVGSGWPC